MSEELKSPIALVTGGSRGIGAAIVKQLVTDGYFVYFTYHRNYESAKRLEDEINTKAILTKAVKVSFDKPEEQKGIFNIIRKERGRIDALVNNAGITKDVLLARMKMEEWDEVMESNLKSVFVMTKLALDLMLPNKKGNIINMASVSGIRGALGQCNYAASKGGIIALTKSLARELSSFNIRVNAIAPGFIETEMTNTISGSDRRRVLQTCLLGRFGRADEIANVVSFLASDKASYIQGQVLVVDGGVL